MNQSDLEEINMHMYPAPSAGKSANAGKHVTDAEPGENIATGAKLG